MKKRYEILPGLPGTGPMYIPISSGGEPFYSEGFAVRFWTSNGKEWIANFAEGWTNYSKVFDFPERNRVVVIAKGQGYIMNPDQQRPLKTFGITINEVIQSKDGTLFCSDGLGITMLNNRTGEFWESPRISLDGIKGLHLTNNMLLGHCYNPLSDHKPWTPFELNINTKEVKGGSYTF